MTARSIAGLVGFLAALIGLLFLFVPVHAETGVDCGHVLGGSSDGACSAARVERWEFSLPLLVLGAAVAVGTSMGAAQAGRVDEDDEDDVTAP